MKTKETTKDNTDNEDNEDNQDNEFNQDNQDKKTKTKKRQGIFALLRGFLDVLYWSAKEVLGGFMVNFLVHPFINTRARKELYAELKSQLQPLFKTQSADIPCEVCTAVKKRLKLFGIHCQSMEAWVLAYLNEGQKIGPNLWMHSLLGPTCISIRYIHFSEGIRLNFLPFLGLAFYVLIRNDLKVIS